MQITSSLPVSTDSRDAWARLRRTDCVKLAKYHKIADFNEDWPKDRMVDLLKIRGVNPANGIEWDRVEVQQQDGSTKVEYYPKRKLHASAANNVDASAELNRRIEAINEKERENTNLKDENSDLRKQLADLRKMHMDLVQEIRGTEVTQDMKDDPSVPLGEDFSAKKRGELMRLAKAKGMEVTVKTKKAELLEFLNGENTP